MKNYTFTFGLHHILLISWLGLIVGMIVSGNLTGNIGMIEWVRVTVFVGLLYGVIGIFAWRNKRQFQTGVE